MVGLALAVVAAAAVWQTETSRSSRNSSTAISIDLRATRQVIDGFGSSERVWSDPHLADDPGVNVPVAAQQRILRLVYGTIGLTRVRDILDQGVQRQPGRPFDFAGKLADDHVAYVKQARGFGLRVFFPGPVYLEPWMRENDPGATVAWAMAMLRRWRELGAAPKLYAPLNEPRIDGNYAPEWMRQVALQLGRRLRADGFDTRLVIPDDENPSDALRRAEAVLADREARQYVGALAYHVYRWGDWDVQDMFALRKLATRYGLPLWMTEYSNTSYTDWKSSMDWAAKMHFLLARGEVNAVDYFAGFFGERHRTATMVSIDFDGGRYVSHTVTPVGAITGQYAHFVRPGFVRVATTSSSSDVLVSAYKGPKRAVVIATNTGASTASIRVRVAGGKVAALVRPVRSSASEQWRSLPLVRLRTGSFTAALPPLSITSFVLKLLR